MAEGDVSQVETQHINGVPYPGDTPEQIKAKLGKASPTNDGYLTKEDWITFNNKQAAVYVPENIASKTIDIHMGGLSPSDILYPSQKAVKTYIDDGVIVTVSSLADETAAFAAGAKMVIRQDLL